MSEVKPDSMPRDSQSVPAEESHADREGVESPGQSKSFQQQMREFERQIITAALEEMGGSVTRAAKKLGLSHQGLCYIINFRHRELLSLRNPVRARRRSIITKVKGRRINETSPAKSKS